MLSWMRQARDRFCIQLGCSPPSLEPSTSMTWAVSTPSIRVTALYTVPSSPTRASRWTSSTILMEGYCSRYRCTASAERS
ncbi:Uncharacterised protein [Flavonifractor plautii]|uniref:Ig-like domain-containing protein n=1 Tax=Flavonifractor plautii TaxID=292800 RepID=A0A173ZN55_FLAPL|nr:Uncharacterised protein [Flavonifractor plautii]